MPPRPLARGDLLIRPLQRADRSAVRAICVATAWLGQPADDWLPDEWIWAEWWTRYFTDRERTLSWVVQRRDDRRVVGYLLGTADVRGPQWYEPTMLPGIVARAIKTRLLRRATGRRVLGDMLSSLLGGELRLPAGVLGRYPATFHFNLLLEVRGQGLGSALFGCFRRRLIERGVPGVHAQVLSLNAAVARFAAREGFRRVAGGPIRAFARVHPGPVSLDTWVSALDGGLAGTAHKRREPPTSPDVMVNAG